VVTHGDGDRPIWDALTYEPPGAAGWTHLGSGIWKKTFAAFYVRRVFCASLNSGALISQRTVGPALRRALVSGVTNSAQNASEANIIAGLSASSPWAPGGATTSFALYMWTGSSTVSPPDYYQGLAFIQADGATVGAVDALQLRNVQNVLIRDQMFRGMSGAAVRLSAQNSDDRDVANVEVIDCASTHTLVAGVLSRRAAELAPTWVLRNAVIRRFHADYSTNANEQEQTTSESALSGVGDGFAADHGSVSVRFENCTAKNPFHNGCIIGGTLSGLLPPVNCSFVDGRVEFSEWTTYSRGLSCTNGTGNIIDRNVVVGQTTRSQIAGSVKVRGNRWLQCKTGARKPAVAQWVGVESYHFDNGSGLGNSVRYVEIWPTDVEISGNYAEANSVNDEALAFNAYASSLTPLWPANSVRIANNVVKGWGYALRAQNFGGNAATIQVPTMQNNTFHNGTTGATRVYWKPTSAAAVEYPLATAPGCTNTGEADPQLDAAGRPMAGSPVIGSGVHISYSRDANRVQRPNPPSRGAYDVQRVLVKTT
jgi:hypothetical protein